MAHEKEIIQPVILCGGSGTRLWPLSREEYPKQFLCLNEDKSLFQQALGRLNKIKIKGFHAYDPVTVAGEEHRFLVVEQCRQLGQKTVVTILEPEPRNTAPALTMAALLAAADGNDPILVVTPADQAIDDDFKFNAAICSAVSAALDGSIVVLGTKPTRPETGYGYIRALKMNEKPYFDVIQFVEKPDEVNAQSFFEDENFFWNAGVFVLRASAWISAIKKSRPDIFSLVDIAWRDRAEESGVGFDFVRPNAPSFQKIPGESVDYAVMERCLETDIFTKMVEIDAGWNDLGCWAAILDHSVKDKNGNSIQGDVKTLCARNSLVWATSRLVVLVGLDGVSVIETPDAILVADKDNSQKIKKIVAEMQDEKREEYQRNRKTYRPWGWFDSVDEGERFKVKRIQVKPGQSLSLQSHIYRSEHWIVVRGQAEVINEGKTIHLNANQSTYIPAGTTHRLSNPGHQVLEIIEVQTGDYLGEDDIVRYEDYYGRQ